MDDQLSRELLKKVVLALEQAGYNPCDQLEGYLKTGNNTYITRSGDARELISLISRDCIKEYLETGKIEVILSESQNDK